MINFSSENENKVYKILYAYPKSRDNDMLLVAYVWKSELGANDVSDLDEISVRYLFKKMVSGEVTHFETIRRTRAKLQEKHPEVRGEKYLKRLQRQDELKEDLGYGVRE